MNASQLRRMTIVAAALPATMAATDAANRRLVARSLTLERLAGEIAAMRHQRNCGWEVTPVECGTFTDPRWWSWPDGHHWGEKPGRPLGPVMLRQEGDAPFLSLRGRELDRLATMTRDLGDDVGLDAWLDEADALPWPYPGTFGEAARRELAGPWGGGPLGAS